MRKRFSGSILSYAIAALLVLSAGLVAWTIWGEPSLVALAWTGAVGLGLVVATGMAVRDGAPTRSVAHVLYDTEQAAAPLIALDPTRSRP